MLKFTTSREYIDALGEDGSLAVVSFGIAARALRVTRPTIERMLDDHRLTEIVVGKTRCIRAQDVVEIRKTHSDTIVTVEKLLERCAKRNKIVFYDPVMSAIDLDWRNPPHRKKIGGILGSISTSTHKDKKKRFLLSVIVHKKGPGKTKPSPSFFTLARQLGYKFEDEDSFAEAMLDKVFKFYGSE